MAIKKVPGWISALLVAASFGLLVWLERRRPLRHPVDSKLRRTGRNMAVAAIGAFALQLTEKPVADSLTGLVERRRLGLLKRAHLPSWLEVPLGEERPSWQSTSNVELIRRDWPGDPGQLVI